MGSNGIIPDQEYAPLETTVMVLELVLASTRLPGCDTPHGNTKLLGTRAVPSERTPEQAIMVRMWVCLSCLQNDKDFLCGLGLASALVNIRARAQWA